MKTLAPISVYFLFVAMIAQSANAERLIFVNGKQLSVEEIEYIDQLACRTMADGDYWLDPDTGVWGFRGDPTMRGRLLGQCDQLTVVEPSADFNSHF